MENCLQCMVRFLSALLYKKNLTWLMAFGTVKGAVKKKPR
jgi:hypothetical protein